jgi:LysM repeat protein
MPTSTNIKVRNLREKRESLKSQPSRPRKTGRRRHVLPANITSEGEWTSGPAPQVKTSRMFLGMLALHLVAVGGLVAFHYYGHDGAASAPNPIAAPASAPTESREAKPANPAPAVVAASKSPAPRPVPVARTQPPASTPSIPVTAAEHYIVRMDESWESIARARAISVEDLRAANPEVEFNVGRRITIPPSPRVITGVTERQSERKGLTIVPPTSPGNAYNHYVPNPDAAPLMTAAADDVATPPPTKATPTTIGGPVKANATAPSSSKTALAGKTHIVSKGDTLFAIAKRRGITEKSLMRYNGITDASKLRIGQKIKLPAAD